MPQILAIETTHPQASIAFLRCDGEVVEREFESHRQQNQMMFEPLQQLLRDELGDGGLDLILVGVGPGSYSGARIAIAAAHGVGVVHGCDVVGMSSFHGLEELCSAGRVVAVGDARRGSYFILDVVAGELVDSPKLVEKDDFLLNLAQARGLVVTMETQNEIPGGGNVFNVRPKASVLIESWLRLEEADQKLLQSKPVAPAYLRAPFITKAKAGHPLLRGKKN